MEKKPDRLLSLFVLHWNRPAECSLTVTSLLSQEIPLQVVVIDNASNAEAFQLLKSKMGPAISVVRLPENRGWGGALNIFLRKWLEEGSGPYCLISAHDAVPEPNCLRLMIEAIDADSAIGIACPQYPNQTIARFSTLRGVHPEKAVVQAAGSVQLVDVPHGTLMLLRRECLQQIGLFDERYFAYGDEHELGVRAVRNGWRVVMVWGAVVTNPGTWISSPLRSYLLTRNSLLLVHDYRGKLAAWIRAILISLNTLRLMVGPPNKDFAFSVKARLAALRDFVLGRYGRPDFFPG